MAINPCRIIPLDDYESHMADAMVGQLALLNVLTKKYLEMIKPFLVIVAGIAGGNGLEHIDNTVTKKVTGIDINQKYLNTTYNRYHHKISTLQLLRLDLAKTTKTIGKADLIWAALLLEYTGINNSLDFFLKNLKAGGHLVITIQSNHQLNSVSNTGIGSVKKAAEVFHPVDPDLLSEQTKLRGFNEVNREENTLPNGKSLITIHFKLTL